MSYNVLDNYFHEIKCCCNPSWSRSHSNGGQWTLFDLSIVTRKSNLMLLLTVRLLVNTIKKTR
jgi:hypothetical protein